MNLVKLRSLPLQEIETLILVDLFADGVEPPSPEELGASTWTLLHSLAVNYDVNPSKEKQQKMQQLFDSLLEFYPCENCRKKLKYVSLRKLDLQIMSTHIMYRKMQKSYQRASPRLLIQHVALFMAV